ncbi:MAG TPA: Na+/H+ antiporter NhaA, partial [Acetobacteraceae bacterium]|nr:Na+/H+ antiporter NhaA [Acetobacteraceae bacterium]
WSRRALPGLAAAGGMAVPAAIFLFVNSGSPELQRGWAIPAATDIAFALGVLSLLGDRVPTSLKIFLTAIAILDDLGAVVIIAAFYTAELSITSLLLAGGVLAALVVLNRLGVTALLPYLVLGAVLWVLVLRSGVHATIAGVLLAFTIPLHASPGRPDDHDGSPLHRLEHALHPWSAFLIVPVFGFANAGVSLAGIGWVALAEGLTLGIALGLVVGKFIGVFGASMLAIRLGLADVPMGAGRAQLAGIALLCGIGFTMSLFIALLAFPGSEVLQDQAKIGILAGSLVAALLGTAVLLVAPRDVPPPGTRRPTATA